MFNERDRRCAAVQHMRSTNPSYDNRIQVMTTLDCYKLQGRALGDENKVSGYGYGLWCVFKRGPHHATSHLRSRLESQHQGVPGYAEECGDPGCGSRTRRRPISPKRPRLRFGRSAKTLYTSLTGSPPPPTWTRWTTSFGHTSRTSPTWRPTTPKPAWSPPSAEYSPSSRLWKRHAPSSGFVSKRWLRLMAASLNRCQLYYIIKLPELIFFNKSFKIKL